MQQRDRQWRRDQRDRVIEKVFQHYRNTGWGLGWNENSSKDPLAAMNMYDAAVRRHSSRVTCSNWCCGNPRKWFNAPTIAELKFNVTCNEVFADAGIRVPKIKTNKKW